MRRTPLLVTVALSVLAACGEGPPDAESSRQLPSDAAPAASLPDSVPCDGLERRILAAPATRAGLRGALGAPDTVLASTAPNRHLPGATDSLFTLRWPGVELRVRVPPDGEDLPVRAEATSNRAMAHPWIGVRAEGVVGVLGEPTTRREGELVYDCGPGARQPVTFHLGRRGVERVVVSFYVG